jgi:hypothetical protein
MSNGGSGKTELVIPFEPKLNLRSEAADPWTLQAKQFWTCFARLQLLLRQTTNRRAKSLTSYRLKF